MRERLFPVMIMEEHDGLRAAVADALALGGFEPLEAASPEIAGEVLRSHRSLGAAVGDPTFAGRDAEAVLASVSALARERGVPFLLVTDDLTLAASSFRLGVAACLPKPFDLETLLFLVRALGRGA